MVEGRGVKASGIAAANNLFGTGRAGHSAQGSAGLPGSEPAASDRTLTLAACTGIPIGSVYFLALQELGACPSFSSGQTASCITACKQRYSVPASCAFCPLCTQISIPSGKPYIARGVLTQPANEQHSLWERREGPAYLPTDLTSWRTDSARLSNIRLPVHLLNNPIAEDPV